MKYEVRIGGVAGGGAGKDARTVEIARDAQGHVRVRLEGDSIAVDAIEIAAGTYSIRIGAAVYEVRVLAEAASETGKVSVLCRGEEFHASVRDPRSWRGGHGGVQEAQGRQRVAAPMPGKVVRVLVAAGDMVEARQGLVVVEAMKMQNEIRAPKRGLVERVFVQEGQNVTAGEPLIVIA